ncbi:IS21 family transposase [Nannocystis pusilla]|uniref:IS21 family transposase n=1 Tax=Nannocystis pusilla TaxID=889268 RepID=UPI003DA4FBCE
MGLPARRIAKELGMGPNTERRYRQILADAGLLGGEVAALPELDVLRAAVECALPAQAPPQQEVSSVAEWRADIERLHAGGARPGAIYDWLRRERPGFSGSYAAVKRLCRRLGEARGPVETDVVIPIDAPPGEAQVDFGYLGHLYDPDSGRQRKAWVFLLVLVHSRRMVARIAFDQSAETWIRLHVEAFEELGGAPTVIVPDNLKAAVVRTAFGIDERAALHRSYRELARHYGCRIDPAPPQSPEKKGRVEAGVRSLSMTLRHGAVHV